MAIVLMWGTTTFASKTKYIVDVICYENSVEYSTNSNSEINGFAFGKPTIGGLCIDGMDAEDWLYENAEDYGYFCEEELYDIGYYTEDQWYDIYEAEMQDRLDRYADYEY